ncbi:MAG: glycosyltransferase [Marinifilaceae bacterium]
MDFFAHIFELYGSYTYLLVAIIALFLIYACCEIYKTVRIVDKKKCIKSTEEGISVIISSKNSAEFLEKNLIAFLTQDYAEYEVIVVDECSDDDTQDVLEKMQERYPNLRCTKIPQETKFRHTKKIAINIGVLAAKYDILLFSEITATPVSKQWIRSMQENFDEDTVAVVGYSNFSRGSKRIDFPFMYNFLNYIGLIGQFIRGYYLLGNGYNMAYRKSTYMACRGFTYNSQIYLGYDCDIIKILARNGKVKIAKNNDSFIEMERDADRSCNDVFMYRLANIKQWDVITMLKINWLSVLNIVTCALLIWMLVSIQFWQFALIMVLMWWMLRFFVLLTFLRKFEQTKLVLTTFMYTTVGIFYTVYITYGCSIFIGKKWR